jgi:hypothetical protein
LSIIIRSKQFSATSLLIKLANLLDAIPLGVTRIIDAVWLYRPCSYTVAVICIALHQESILVRKAASSTTIIV